MSCWPNKSLPELISRALALLVAKSRVLAAERYMPLVGAEEPVGTNVRPVTVLVAVIAAAPTVPVNAGDALMANVVPVPV